MNKYKFHGNLDEEQSKVYRKVPSDCWLSDKDRCHKLVEWNTFFRRNLNKFAEFYLGVKSYPYQEYLLYAIGTNTVIDDIAARGTAKSYDAGVAACCISILYPKSKVVITSGTLRQAEIIIMSKIKNELMNSSENLRREVESIKKESDILTVHFWNGSTIKALPPNDNARGERSTFTIYDECRMIKKNVVDSVYTQMFLNRQVGYKNSLFYEDKPDIILESNKSLYITSAWYMNHWLGRHILQTYKDEINNKKSKLLAFDYSVSLKHNLKSREDIIKDKKNIDPLSFRMEIENEMIRENTSAFFTYSMFTKNQSIKRPFYPARNYAIKNRYSIPKVEGEIRIVSCDMAFITNSINDNSIFSLIRLLPETRVYNNTKEMSQGFRRQTVYLESIQGGETQKQALRIKQLFEDFEADYCVLDCQNAGIGVYDCLARVMYDEERDKEYPAWTSMNDESLRTRIHSANAKECLYTIKANQALNSSIANSFRQALTENKIEFLISLNQAKEEYLIDIPEYQNPVSLDDELFYEKPFIETAELIEEACSLVYEKKENTGVISLHEQGFKRKDRYTSVSYGNYFADQLERDLFSQGNNYSCGFYFN